MDNTYTNGALVRVFGTFKSTAGAVADPTTVQFRYKAPGSTLTTFTYSTSQSTIVRDSTGVYHSDVVANVRGVWRYRWNSSGAVRSADEKQFRVEPGLV